MHSLPLFHRIAGTKVVLVGGGEMAEAKRRLIERAGGVCVGEDEARPARLAFVAVADGADEIAARLKAQGLLVNVADRPDLCDFTLPSVLERGDVLVAVSTGGASAGLAKHLRLRIEGLLPQSLGALAAGLHATRYAMRARWPDPGERRRALDAALAQDGLLDPLADGSDKQIEPWLRGEVETEGFRVADIVLTSADPDELTLRAARLLGAADVIVHDDQTPPAILARARADAARTTERDFVATSGLTVRLTGPGPADG